MNGTSSKSATWMPRRAMVLAAGRGERMRPITETLPKPLIEVDGQAMIDRVLDRLALAGVEGVVVNVHHLAPKVESHLSERRDPRIEISQEADLLETGGGVRQALPLLGDEPFFVISGDVVWLDGRMSALQRLADAYDPTRMDCLLLLHPTVAANGYDGPGDFVADPMGKVRWRKESEIAPFVFTGMQIIDPCAFEGVTEIRFPLRHVYGRLIERERLYGLRHEGEWFHVGRPEDIAVAEHALATLDSELF